MIDVTLCFVLKDDKVLLGLKKKKLGKNLWNGFGGKVESGETIEEATRRELEEESHLIAKDLTKVGVIDFLFKDKPQWNQRGHIFLCHEFQGIPKETEEMKPQWFDKESIPLHQMWVSDTFWVPNVLNHKCVEGSLLLSVDGTIAYEVDIREVKELQE